MEYNYIVTIKVRTFGSGFIKYSSKTVDVNLDYVGADVSNSQIREMVRFDANQQMLNAGYKHFYITDITKA